MSAAGKVTKSSKSDAVRVRVSEGLADWVKYQAKLEDVTESEFIRKAILQYLIARGKANHLILDKRLGMKEGTVASIRGRKTAEEFSQWSQAHDQDGLTWEYLPQERRYQVTTHK